MKTAVIFLILVLLTPFGLVLSLMPGYHGPKEWFEFVSLSLKGRAA